MKRVLKFVGWTVGVILVIALGVCAYAYYTATSMYNRQWSVHAANFPIPFPLTADELAAIRADRAAAAPGTDPLAGLDMQAIALERAVRRGDRLVHTRLGCNGCHGDDFGGKAVIDQAIVGHWIAPNLTSGAGSVTRGFTATEWDHAVRHGVRHTGKSSSMPSEEFLNLSDHELSDVAAYINSLPPVNRDLGPSTIGPIFSFVVTFQGLAAFGIDHDKPHPVEPPTAAPSVEYGQHIVQVCRGCHGPNLSGGKVAGDPNMPIVGNLTPHETGLKGWTETDFLQTLRTGQRKDGTTLAAAMPWRVYGQMGDTELKAIFAYLQTLSPIEKGKR